MKNELDPWEVGIAEQMKGKEFSFDPQAFADFENLLQAEALGQEPGHQAPDAAGEIMSAGGVTSASLPIILVAIGLACFTSWWFWPREVIVHPEPELTISAPAAPPAPATGIAPATAPESTTVDEPNEPAVTPELMENKPLNVPVLIAPANNGQEISFAESGDTAQETFIPPPRILQAANTISTLPIQAVVSLDRSPIPLPPVQKPTPFTRRRDRKALFPDIIKKN